MQEVHTLTRRYPLEEIHAFVEVGAAGSFTAAAERLNTSHSSLSRKVAHLEDWIGTKLLERRANGVVLTAAGIGYFQRFRDGLSIISEAAADAIGGRQPDMVRISLFHIFATHWLFPRHLELKRRTGGIEVEYNFERHLSDFSDGTNLAIRYGTGEWPHTIAQRMLSEPIYPVAGRHLAEEFGNAVTPEKLLEYPLIHMGNESAWRNWLSRHGIAYRMRRRDLMFEDQLLVMKAMQHGLGIGLSHPCISTMFDRGDLLSLGFKKELPDSAYWLVRPRHRPLSFGARIYARELLTLAGVEESGVAYFLG